MGTKALIEMLVASRADIAGWISPCDQMPTNVMPLYLGLETPLHMAVEAEDERMLQFLPYRHHKPDIFLPALETRPINAIIFTLTKRSLWHFGFNLLATYSGLKLRTPLFGCHILHFAVAALDLNLLQHTIDAGDPQVICKFQSTALLVPNQYT